jgi:hypothetical protein
MQLFLCNFAIKYTYDISTLFDNIAKSRSDNTLLTVGEVKRNLRLGTLSKPVSPAGDGTICAKCRHCVT